MQVQAADGVSLHAEVSGAGDTALVFVHGWLGSGKWWNSARDAFVKSHVVVQLDLASHGASGERAVPTAAAYIDDIVAVTRALDVKRVVLVGHSMSGVYVLGACAQLPQTVRVVVVDTLKNVEQSMPMAQVDAMLAMYRTDYARTLEQVAGQWLFAKGTPEAVKQRLLGEFLSVSGETSAKLLEPLYRVDVMPLAKAVTVPVRAINGDLHPTNVEANQRAFRDYAVRVMPGLGHYPMLEAPEAFNEELRLSL